MSKNEMKVRQEILTRRIMTRNNFIKEAEDKKLQDRLREVNKKEVKNLMQLRKDYF